MLYVSVLIYSEGGDDANEAVYTLFLCSIIMALCRCEVKEDCAAASIIENHTMAQLAIMNTAITIDIHYHCNKNHDP